MREKIERWLWYIFVFVLPWQTVWIFREVLIAGEKWQYGTVPVFISEVILLLWFGAAFWGKQKGSLFEELKRADVYQAGTFLLVWMFLSIFWAHDKVLVLLYSGIFFLGVGLLYGIQHWKIDFRKTILVFSVSLALHSCIALGQFIMQESPAVSLLGMAQHYPQDAGTSVLKSPSERILRAYGGMNHPNVLAGALTVGILLASWLWIFSRSMVERITVPFLIFLELLALVLTFSRSAWIGFILGFLLFFGWLYFRKKDWRGRIVPVFVLITAALVFSGVILREQIIPRFEKAPITLEGSVRDRVQLVNDALSVWKQHPMLGVGLGNSTSAVMEREFGRSFLEKAVPVWEYQPAHNIFIVALTELGIIGLTLFVFVFVRVIWSGWVYYIKGTDSRGIATFACVVALVPSVILDHWLWTSYFGIVFILFLLGLLFRYTKIPRVKE